MRPVQRYERRSQERLKQIITGKRFDKHIDTLIPILIPPCGKHVQGIVQIEIVITIEMAPNELIDLGLGGGVHILEFMHSLKLDDIQAIGQYPIRLAFQQMLTLVCRNMGDGRKDISTVSSRTFNTVSVIDTTFPSFVIDVEVLKIIVEIYGTGTEVSAKKSGMGSEDGSDVDMTFTTEGDSEASLPLVKVGDDGCGGLASDVLRKVCSGNRLIKESAKTHVAKEPGDEITKDNGLVCLVVIWRTGNASKVPEVALPLIETRIHGAGIEKQHMRTSLNKPATIKNFDALRLHRLEGCSKVNVCRVLRLDLHRGRLVGERADEAVSVAKLRDSDRDFGLDDRVDAADLVSNLPGTLEHLWVLHIALPVVAHVSTSKTTCMIIYYLSV